MDGSLQLAKRKFSIFDWEDGRPACGMGSKGRTGDLDGFS